MKIERINENLGFDKMMNQKYPLKCKYKDRTPDPGICWIISIDFENKRLDVSNGRYRYSPDFDDVEFIPDLFIYSKYNL